MPIPGRFIFINYLHVITESEVVTGKFQTEALKAEVRTENLRPMGINLQKNNALQFSDN